MDSTGFSDPYCKVSLTPLSNKAHRQKTAIKKRTLNPEFNEVRCKIQNLIYNSCFLGFTIHCTIQRFAKKDIRNWSL